MSQSGVLVTAASMGCVLTLTGDAGGALSPTLGNINVLGGSNITTTGLASTLTLDLTGTTTDSLQIGNATGSLTSLPVGTNGQLVIGATGASPLFATLTSSDGSITFTPGVNTLDLQASDPTTFNADIGSALPAADILIITGGNNVSTSGAGNTLTIDLTGTTINSLQMGNATGSLTSLAIGTNGQLVIGATGAAPAFGTVISTDGSILFGLGVNSLDLQVSGGFAGTYTTDSGNAIPAAGILNVLGGDNMNTAGAGNSVTIHLNETIHWPDTNAAGTTGIIYLGGAGGAGGSLFMHNMGTTSTYLGTNAGNITMNAATNNNTGIGFNALINANFGGSNTALGAYAGANIINSGNATLVGKSAGLASSSNDGITGIGAESLFNSTSNNNTGCGFRSGYGITIGYENCAFGYLSMNSAGLTGERNTVIGASSDIAGSGSYNTILGWNGGLNLAAGDSSNILIQHFGIAADNNTIRIGTQGVGDGLHNRCFIAGIYGVDPSLADEQLVIMDSSGQLGTLSQANGELLIGSTGATPVAAGLTAGSGITVTNGVGTITIDSSGGGLTWNETVVVGPTNMVVSNGYIANNAGLVTLTLPATASLGDIVRVSVKGAGLVKIAQNAGQTIHFGTSDTTTGVGGDITATAVYDAVELVCITTNTDFSVISSMGNWSIT